MWDSVPCLITEAKIYVHLALLAPDDVTADELFGRARLLLAEVDVALSHLPFDEGTSVH